MRHIIAPVALCVVLFIMMDSSEATKAKKSTHRRKLKITEPLEADSVRDEDIAPSMCHKIALRRCGQNFMKLFNLVDYLDGMDHYNAQCALRKAFFACHEKLRQKPCKRRITTTSAEEKKFVAKLSEAIWATRVCVLGIQRVDEIPGTGKERRRI